MIKICQNSERNSKWQIANGGCLRSFPHVILFLY